MTKRAWYLGRTEDEIAERIILIGDPARVSRLSEHLDNVVQLPVNRGLTTATGEHKGVKVTLASFGMGAPIASIVMHELSALGASVFLRIGTCMCLAPVQLGDLVVATRALSFEGTSGAYARDGSTPEADRTLVKNIINTGVQEVDSLRAGTFASYDGFYQDMFPLDEKSGARVSDNFDTLRDKGVLAVDMETSALLTVGEALGRRASSFCIASVDGNSRKKLDDDALARCEEHLAEIALDSIIATPVAEDKSSAVPVSA